MKKLLAGALLLIATGCFAKDRQPLNCEVEKYSPAADALNLVCPPLFDFSPIRVQISLGKIDPAGWANLDLAEPTSAKVMQGEAGTFLVRLPHRQGNHRWLAWREFARLKAIRISKDNLQ